MNLKQKMEAAKAAYDAAVTAKKAKAEIDNLKAAYDAAKAAFEASDEAKGANDPQDDPENVVTLDEIKDTVAQSVKAAIDASDLKGKDGVTLDQVNAAVTKALKNFKAGEDMRAQIVEAAKAATGEVVANLRKEKKSIHNADDAHAEGKGAGSGDLEVPESWSRGNLPVAGKQLLNRLLGLPQDQGIDAARLTKAARVGDNMFLRFKAQGIKALTTSGSGTGAEWVPSDLGSELMRRLFLSSELAMLFASREIEMPTPVYTLPLSTTRPTFKLTSESTENALEGSPGTGEVVLTSKKLTSLVEYTYEQDEDSIVPILPTLLQLLGEGAAYALEDAIINGDTTATHQDSDTNAVSRHAAKSWNGLRKLALAVAGLKSDLASGGISAANLRALKKLLKKYGVNPRNCAWVVGPSGENDMLGLDGVTTLEQFGPQATNLTGKIAAFLGIPIITSEANREDLNATGVYDGVTTTKGSVLLANVTQFLMGNRRGFTIETDRNIVSQVNQIVTSFRKAFTPIETPSATVTSVAAGYNYNA